jgi:hypothetical protein
VTDWELYLVADSSLAALEEAQRNPPSATLPPYDPATARALVAPDGVPADCWWATRRFAPDESASTVWFSSAGGATVYVNGRRVHADAVGNAGVVDAVRLAMPERGTAIAVRTCSDRTFGAGFYWRRLPA